MMLHPVLLWWLWWWCGKAFDYCVFRLKSWAEISSSSLLSHFRLT